MPLRSVLPALLLTLLTTGAAYAKSEVYKWVDKDGVVHYSGDPPSKDAKPATLPELQTYKPSAHKTPISTLDADTSPTCTGGVTVAEVRVTAPQADEIFRDTTGTVPVAATVLPAPPAGVGYVFYLDGARQNPKASATPSYSLSDVERGSHTVAVAVVDAAGKELKRSAPVTFHSKPPSAH